MGEFFERLKQRKIVQWALAYIAASFALIQVLDIVAQRFGWPEHSVRFIIIALAVGFFVVLVLAWYHGERGAQRVTGTELLILALLLSIGGGVMWRLEPSSKDHAESTGDTTTAKPTVEAEAAAARSIAVLPFVNMSGDPKNEYFSDGLAETTLDMLAQVADLKVIARTSSFAFKGKAQDMRQIGIALGAANLLEGSVQQAGDTLRITAQLIKAADGSHLWSHHYDRPIADVFKIQDEIATQVVQELAIALPASQQQRLTQKRTENVDAYQEYLKGIALMPRRKVSDMREAVQHFERAITLDPTYARAYAAAADAYELLDGYGTITAAERLRIDNNIDRALALSPDLGEAHISRGRRSRDKYDLPGAEREFRRGLKLAPSYATGFMWYSELLSSYGRVEEALAMIQRAATLDPLSPIVQGILIWTTSGIGRFNEAETLLAKLHIDHPDFAKGYVIEAELAATQGDLVRALRAMREQAALDPAATTAAGCFIRMRFGAFDEARRCRDALASRAPDSPNTHYLTAFLNALSADWAGALAQCEQMSVPNQGLKAFVLKRLGRYDEVLTIDRRAHPELFVTPLGKLYLGQVSDATDVGLALLHTGAQAQGQAMLRQVLQAWAARPHIMDGDQWVAVYVDAALGEHEPAIAALKRGVADGYFLDLAYLDNDPLMAELRADPRYQQILAPARAKAAAQIAAARAAGLL